MLREYRKKTTIKAEQFDGSDEMVKKYNLLPVVTNPGVYWFGNLYVASGDVMIFAKSEDDEWYPLTSMSENEFRCTYERVD